MGTSEASKICLLLLAAGVVISLLVISSYLQSSIIHMINESSVISNLPNDDLTLFLLSTIVYTDLFLIDENILKVIDSGNPIQLCKNCDGILFGLFDTTNFSSFLDHLEADLPLNLTFIRTAGHRYVKIKLDETSIDIVQVEKHKKFWKIGGTREKPFRAVLPSTLVVHKENNLIFNIPNNIEFFLWQLERSEFIGCNATMAESVKQIRLKYNKSLTPVISDLQFENLPLTRDILYESRKDGFLFGGTLLGWYRDCDLIHDTTDLDFALKSFAYDYKFEEKLIGDKRIEMYWILGRLTDSLELSFYKNGAKVDLFLLYPLNANETYVSGMKVPEKQSIRYIFPHVTRLCTGAIRHELFFVPCNFKEFLGAEYGPKWYIPHFTSDYIWDKSAYNIRLSHKWSESQWLRVYRKF